MNSALQQQLSLHLQRHARRLHRLACGFGRQRDADDIIQTLYARWWRRMNEEPDFVPPDSHVALFVCVKRAALDQIAVEQRDQRRDQQALPKSPPAASPEDSLAAFDRLRWIMDRMPAPLAEALMGSLATGSSDDREVAAELGLTHAAFTMRLHKARRAAEELAGFYEHLSLEQANLMAACRYGGRSRAQLAHDFDLSAEELSYRLKRAESTMLRQRKAAS